VILLMKCTRTPHLSSQKHALWGQDECTLSYHGVFSRLLASMICHSNEKVALSVNCSMRLGFSGSHEV